MNINQYQKRIIFNRKKEHTYLLHYVCGHSGLVATTRPATAIDLRRMEAAAMCDCRLSANAPMQVRFQKRHPDATMPTQGTPGSAGYDMTAVSMERKNGPDCVRYGHCH